MELPTETVALIEKEAEVKVRSMVEGRQDDGSSLVGRFLGVTKVTSGWSKSIE